MGKQGKQVAIAIGVAVGVGIILSARGGKKMGPQVPQKQTPMSHEDAMAALWAAMPDGSTRDGLNLVSAQSALETNWWGTNASGGPTGGGFSNYNFGNVTPAGDQAWMTQGPKGMRYRAFDNPQDGAAAMVQWLQSHKALDAASAGDLDGYMNALRAGCYLGCIGRVDPTGHTVSQADYDAYRKGIASIMATLAKVVVDTGIPGPV